MAALKALRHPKGPYAALKRRSSTLPSALRHDWRSCPSRSFPSSFIDGRGKIDFKIKIKGSGRGRPLYTRNVKNPALSPQKTQGQGRGTRLLFPPKLW